MTAGWRIEHSHGDAGAFHTRVPEAVRSITFHTVDVPTLVLGSAQSATDVDRRVADALGVQVVQRRSGGGAVLLLPDEFVWVDVVVPAGDPRWSDDVGAAMLWVGEWWAEALGSLGTPGHVHTGRLIRDAWSTQVCWTGLGTGEVVTAAAGPATAVPAASKLVGISQRRTRSLARLQSMCHLRWRPELVAALVAPGPTGVRPTAAELARCAAVPPVDAVALRAALLDHLPA